MRYQEVFNNLQKSINEKGLSLVFANSIKTLKNEFGESVSTKFLRGLSSLSDSRKKTNRINYLISKNKLTTKRALNFYKVRGTSQYKKEVIVWGADKKSQPFNTPTLTDEETRQLNELKQIQNEAGISLFNHAEADFNDRQKTTHAFNIGGGAVVRDVRIIGVGSFEVTKRSEVLFMVE